ncbi:hypothetical protein B0H12DRAFT_1140425 [Mycena haematopus]|nr:hypothetical protein B0H12DRAFT_1140425 [Mycena haematopus]
MILPFSLPFFVFASAHLLLPSNNPSANASPRSPPRTHTRTHVDLTLPSSSSSQSWRACPSTRCSPDKRHATDARVGGFSMGRSLVIERTARLRRPHPPLVEASRPSTRAGAWVVDMGRMNSAGCWARCWRRGTFGGSVREAGAPPMRSPPCAHTT